MSVFELNKLDAPRVNLLEPMFQFMYAHCVSMFCEMKFESQTKLLP